MKKIVIFASGNGSNAENIITYFNKKESIAVVKVFSNSNSAKVLEKAKLLNVDYFVFNKIELESTKVIQELESIQPDLIVLAGFLLKFPSHIIQKYHNKIINIHPALLPKYGGKGMYGIHIHNSVLENKEKESGITIHYVNENYDEGAIIFQDKVTITDCVSADEIAVKIHKLEQKHFPTIIERILTS